jgi:uncharacterized protein YjbI with pentapeptide repeats
LHLNQKGKDMRSRKVAIVGMMTLALSPTAFADGVAQAVDGLESDVGTLESQVALLQTENKDLVALITVLTSTVEDLVEQQSELVNQQRCHTRPGDLQADENGDYLAGVDWSGCDKTGLALWGPLWGGDQTQVLTNADLRFVNFTLANIWGVPMAADLEGAIFKNANLAGSDLSGANIITPDDVNNGKTPTVFINTFCPDGVNSDDVGGTCAYNRAP